MSVLRDATAPRKKYALLKWVRAYNLKHPKAQIERPDGFDPETEVIGDPAREFLKRAQRATNRNVTGQFTRDVMVWLLPPDIRGKVMAVAHGELGVHEWPPGTNRGEVLKYLKAAGIGYGAPWCVSFVYWTLLEAGFKREFLPKYPASTPNWATHARAHGCTKPIGKSLLGDIWLYEWGNGDGMLDHGAFCDDPDPRNATGLSLDGNVGHYGGSVTHVARPASTIAVCIDLVKLYNLK